MLIFAIEYSLRVSFKILLDDDIPKCKHPRAKGHSQRVPRLIVLRWFPRYLQT